MNAIGHYELMLHDRVSRRAPISLNFFVSTRPFQWYAELHSALPTYMTKSDLFDMFVL